MSDVSGWDLSSARQNLIPDEVDRASIQEAIAEAQVRLTSQQDSEADAQELRSRIAVLSSLLAPIRRLPPKILAVIFLHPVLHSSVSRGSIASGLGGWGLDGRGLGPIPAVSSHWRATALSTPEFWALFTITLPGNDNIARLLELYLERSKPCTLAIEIRAPYPDPVHPGILKQLLDSCGRWTTLHLSVNSSHLSLFSPVRGHLQSLENFDLHVSRMGTREDLMKVVTSDAFELAPKLSLLKLSMADNVVPTLPLTQITTFTVSSWNTLSFASECPNLFILSIPQDLHSATPLPRVVVTAPKLLTFPSMLENLTAPNLEFLHIVAGRPLWTHSWFSSFIERSACRPHTLQLDEVVITVTDLLAILSLIPTVHSLIVRSLRPNAVTDKLLARLTVTESSSSPVLLPVLTNLSLTGSYLFSNTALLEMLESRVNFGQPIQRVKLQLTHRQFSEVELGRARAVQRDAVLFSLKCLDVDKQYIRII
ncbi:Nadh:flavin oxidoreductase nadh oxidase [Mycena venus]|uniref:Nadh:flavin oxidoreductase nadh oxidase n=1 Tax=Mycena venus TaxID=2733690 RepID=A0A8H6TW92_9AGAR|nr:Nadh:flavin oxidoreductase nadh oxidase [Mycena venus]